MSAGRIARIITGLLILALFAAYSYKHDQNWIHTEDVAEIASKALADRDAYLEGLEAISVNKTETSAEKAAETSNSEKTEESQTEPAEPAEETKDAAATTTSGRSYDLPDVNIQSWEFMLVNDFVLADNYSPSVVIFENTMIDERIEKHLNALLNKAVENNVSINLLRGFVDYNTSKSIYSKFLAMGFSEKDASDLTPIPGTDEHITGLAVDLTDYPREYLDGSLAETEVYKWLYEHCADYGFILRYPSDKISITGHQFEPWHFRYVGKAAAEFIMDNELCLEEFLELYN